MRKAIADTTICKGCHLCVGQCPMGAISVPGTLNSKGYEIIAVDEETCVGCGACYEMCPDNVFKIVEM